MRGFYTAPYKIAGLNAAKTLLYITAPSVKVCIIIGTTVTNESNATNFQFQAAIGNITTLGTPTATTLVPTPHELGDQAAASTVKVNVTASEPTYGAVNITQEGAASLVGYRHEPAPEERLVVEAGTSVGLRMITTPTAFDADIRFTFQEMG